MTYEELVKKYIKDGNAANSGASKGTGDSPFVGNKTDKSNNGDAKSVKKSKGKKNNSISINALGAGDYGASKNTRADNVLRASGTSAAGAAGGLNPTALLHNNTNLDSDKALDLISTTSPSYPLLASIEKNINYLNSSKGRKKIDELIENIEVLRNNCKTVEFCNYNDITKILVKYPPISGYELSEKLYENKIEDEKTNEKSTMLITGIGTDKQKLQRLEKALKNL